MNRLNVLFVDASVNYGYCFCASNTKVEFMARGLVEQGVPVTIVNSVVGNKYVSERTVIHKNDVGNVVSYPKKGNQLVSWLKNWKYLEKDIASLKQNGAKNVIILEVADFHIYMLYCHLARKYGYKVVVISHEWLPTLTTVHPLRRPFNVLYTKLFGKLVDGILPISEYIIEKIKPFEKPYIKVPVLSEFNGKFTEKKACRYFMYCVSGDYFRVIRIVLDAFKKFNDVDSKGFKLILVLSGTEKSIGAVKDYIEGNELNHNVETYHQLSYDDLCRLYKNASALLIPLNPNSEQDHARFSQKIAEYVSSSAPIISCPVGEVPLYFKDKKTAILCDYSEQGFEGAFRWVSEHEDEARQIGLNGYDIGDKYFNYKVAGKKLYDFLCKI